MLLDDQPTADSHEDVLCFDPEGSLVDPEPAPAPATPSRRPTPTKQSIVSTIIGGAAFVVLGLTLEARALDFLGTPLAFGGLSCGTFGCLWFTGECARVSRFCANAQPPRTSTSCPPTHAFMR